MPVGYGVLRVDHEGFVGGIERFSVRAALMVRERDVHHRVQESRSQAQRAGVTLDGSGGVRAFLVGDAEIVPGFRAGGCDLQTFAKKTHSVIDLARLNREDAQVEERNVVAWAAVERLGLENLRG